MKKNCNNFLQIRRKSGGAQNKTNKEGTMGTSATRELIIDFER